MIVCAILSGCSAKDTAYLICNGSSQDVAALQACVNDVGCSHDSRDYVLLEEAKIQGENLL